jgi:hypothetical protein
MCNNVLSLSLTIAVRPPLWSSIFYLNRRRSPRSVAAPGVQAPCYAMFTVLKLPSQRFTAKGEHVWTREELSWKREFFIFGGRPRE